MVCDDSRLQVEGMIKEFNVLVQGLHLHLPVYLFPITRTNLVLGPQGWDLLGVISTTTMFEPSNSITR